ncbi:phospholipase C [Alkalithermobacter thermoalcaliphilus JW-YL-7 = DSM 7308]|uniref:Phospholipase C n=1 Tax=Alkalithermobacter thermoalcaliphilus JW-YL-7 = DSM 7308 TaxID=1121328 RepID=A0A150FSL5_CLOPD|nr:phospholipase C/P1 nuclease [[Clostridium] paradoxum JW-YL-7 = DSM 7308]SHL19578.1 phospholipase C [[Clostridium] paradoxum JW-YL-7 = DSM 7308]
MNLIEKAYSKALQVYFSIINPLKKKVINTHCKVHKFINAQALKILRNDKYIDEFNFFCNYITAINDGTVWADQDFKSNGHFYSVKTKKGLYGGYSAMNLAKEYYENALKFWNISDEYNSLFYLGACIHIIQDMTIPQHANVKLLDNHRQYENFVKKTYRYIQDFKCDKGAYLLDSVDEYIRFNARVAMKIYRKFKYIKEDNERFYRISRCTVPLAERTSAGAMIMFFKDITKSSLKN